MGLFLLVLVALVKPLGAYMARVYEGQPRGLDKPLGWLERRTYRTDFQHFVAVVVYYFDGDFAGGGFIEGATAGGV